MGERFVVMFTNPEGKSLPFHNYVEPSWLTGEDKTPVATESKLSGGLTGGGGPTLLRRQIISGGGQAVVS